MRDGRQREGLLAEKGIASGPLETEFRDIGSRNPEMNAVDRVLNALRTSGYAHIAQPLSFESFEFISSRIGTIELRTDIRIDTDQQHLQRQHRIAGDRPSTYQAGGLDFHSDNPRMNVLAWYCFEQDRLDGALDLIDTGSVADYLSEQELTILTKTPVMYSSKRDDAAEEELLKEPLLTRISCGYRVYYQSWLLLDTYSPEQITALGRFSDYITHAQANPIRVRLEKHHCLFIDNRRMLHGRNSLPKNSKRHLIRFFLRTPDLRI